MSWDGVAGCGGLTDDDVYAAMAAATAHSQAAAEVRRAQLDRLHDLKILAGRRRILLTVVAVEAEDPELRRAQHVRRGVLPAGAEDDAAADEQHQPFSRQPDGGLGGRIPPL